ncbi:MAG TPA: hypothetical protein PK413_03600, partial [Thermoanaerobaculia bacterium]|nr:hypothetical protein [Thermoanaerobaculia bacterium]
NDDGVAYGWYGLVVLEVPVSSAMSFFAEGRWTDAEDDLSGDFEDLGKLDLSGRALSAGVSWRF